MPKIHFRSYIYNQMQRIDKDIVKCPQIVSADNLSNTKKEERITLHLLMEFAREELSLIKYKTKRRKIIKVHLSLCFVIKYTLSTPWKRKTPCKAAIYKGFVVPRPGLEPGWIAPLVFETSASTYSAIWAWFCRQNNRCKVREKIWMRQIFIRQNIRHRMIRHDFWYLNRKDLEV